MIIPATSMFHQMAYRYVVDMRIRLISSGCGSLNFQKGKYLRIEIELFASMKSVYRGACEELAAAGKTKQGLLVYG